MPVDHRAVQLALRARLVSVLVADTGLAASLDETATGFTRPAGSFLTDGFLVGMEATPVYTAGDGTPGVVMPPLTALSLPLSGTRNASAVPLRLYVGIPALRQWENTVLEPVDGRWHVEEDYSPGPMSLVAGGEADGVYDAEPAWFIRLVGVAGHGSDALNKVGDAILRRFPGGLELTASDGHTVIVRSNPAPYRGQIVPHGVSTSHAVTTITVPLWVPTTGN